MLSLIFSLTSDLDFETEKHYGFVVTWSDNEEVQLSSRVTFIINNDNTFSQAVYRAEVTEEAEPGSRRNLQGSELV